MKKIVFTLLAISSFPFAFVSCTKHETGFTPSGPVSNTSVMPWNRPTGPEGGGILGGALQ
ncbi:MAG: hypothetical protein ACSHX0_02225 [Akkermansiaceae bacterium]